MVTHLGTPFDTSGEDDRYIGTAIQSTLSLGLHGKPFVLSFNGKFKKKCLSQYEFVTRCKIVKNVSFRTLAAVAQGGYSFSVDNT